MRIFTGHICNECCYCLDDYGYNGLCTHNPTAYKPIKINQSACKFFIGDDEEGIYMFG